MFIMNPHRFTSGEGATGSLLTSYGTSNYNNTLPCYESAWDREGESYELGFNADITDVEFYVWKNTSPTGIFYVEIWSHTGSLSDADEYPQEILATSTTVMNIPDIVGTSGTPELVKFNFSPAYSTLADTPYWIICHQEFTFSNSLNYLGFCRDNGDSSPGKMIYRYPNWFQETNLAAIYYIYGIDTS